MTKPPAAFPPITGSAIKPGTFTIHAQERIVFGTPAPDALLSELERLQYDRVFVTSTRSLAKLKDGPLQRIVAALGARCVGTFSEISAHSPREDIITGAKHARTARAQLLVAVGGGSVIDATKAMLMCLWLGLETPEAMEPYREDLDKALRTPFHPDTADPVRMITVSTTLSASEFTPRTVLLDPDATRDTPDWLLYCTGIRAVDHAVESYCSAIANPATEPLSLQGLRLLSHALPGIKADPDNRDTRLRAQIGMWQAIAASTAGAGSGASHGIGYALGATFNVPHGHTSCIMLPAVLQWNASHNADRQADLAAAMNQSGTPAHTAIKTLIAGLDQPVSLRDAGITRDQLPEIAKRAMHYAPVKRNPRPIRSPDDVMEILEIAF